MSRYRLLVILAAAQTLAIIGGCAGRATHDQPVELNNEYLGEVPVYAILARQGDGQWTFDQLTDENRSPDDGYLVRLNDLAPAFDTRQAECEPRPYAENDRCNPLNPFREKDVGVVGKIVDTGITAGTGGKLSSVSRSYTTQFDLLGFNAAVDKALLDTGLDRDRARLINGLAAVREAIAAQNADIADLATTMVHEYERDKRENVVFDLRVTGLHDYYSYDLDPADFVQVLSRTPAVSQKAVDSNAADILPCAAADCMDTLTATLARLEQEHDRRIADLQKKLRSETRSFDVDCSATEHAGYHFRLSCPETLVRAGNDAIVLPVEMNIVSRDFRHLFPNFSKRNDSLAAIVDQGRLVLENRTDDYLDVQSVSLYYNSHINTVTDEDAALDLAPRQRKANPLARFSSDKIDIESEFANMTPDKARRSEFSFGLAVKYSLRDRDSIETIYAVRDFEVHCAIGDRLNRQVCHEPSATK